MIKRVGNIDEWYNAYSIIVNKALSSGHLYI
jgi:hypothetical protein